MSRPRYSVWYILDEDNEIVPCEDWMEHFRWMSENAPPDGRAQIGDTHYENVRVSTVFLGQQTPAGIHIGVPVPFETMVFGGKFDDRVWRYASYADAEIGHQDVCRRVFGRGSK